MEKQGSVPFVEYEGIVVVYDIIFKGKRRICWEEVEKYLKQYIGQKWKTKGNEQAA